MHALRVLTFSSEMSRQLLKNHVALKEIQRFFGHTTVPHTNISRRFTEILREHERDSSIRIKEIDLTAGSKVGDNSLSTLQRAIIKGVKGNDEEFYKTLILKQALDNHSTFFNYAKLWFNEILVYKDILPALEHAVGKKLHYPKMLYGDLDMIILEDLKDKGYAMVDRRAGLNFEHAKLAFEEIANFHSASFIIKATDKKLYDNMVDKMGVHPYQEENSMKACYPMIENAIETVVKILKGGDTKYSPFIQYLAQVKANIPEIINNIVKEPTSVYTVVAHGDFYLSNLLFSYAEKKVDGMMLVDYQGTRMMNLFIDLHHLVYTSIQPEVRREHLNTLLQHYYNCLSFNLRQHAYFDAEFFKEILPFANFRAAFDETRIFGLISAITIMPAMTYHPSNVPDLMKVLNAWKDTNVNLNQYFTEELTLRLQDVADEFIQKDWCKI